MLGVILLAFVVAYLITGFAFAALWITDHDPDIPDRTQLVVTILVAVLIGPGLMLWLRVRPGREE